MSPQFTRKRYQNFRWMPQIELGFWATVDLDLPEAELNHIWHVYALRHIRIIERIPAGIRWEFAHGIPLRAHRRKRRVQSPPPR